MHSFAEGIAHGARVAFNLERLFKEMSKMTKIEYRNGRLRIEIDRLVHEAPLDVWVKAFVAYAKPKLIFHNDIFAPFNIPAKDDSCHKELSNRIANLRARVSEKHARIGMLKNEVKMLNKHLEETIADYTKLNTKYQELKESCNAKK